MTMKTFQVIGNYINLVKWDKTRDIVQTHDLKKNENEKMKDGKKRRECAKTF